MSAIFRVAKVLAILCCLAPLAARTGRAAELGWLPPGRIFQPLEADPTYPAFSARYSAAAREGWRAQANMGGEFAIAGLETENGSSPRLGIAGGVAARFDVSRVTNDFEIADFTLAFPLDWRAGPVALRAMYWHTSSHIGDDYIISNALSPSQLSKHVTDDLRLLASVNPARFLRIYGGGGWALNQIPHVQKRWRAQFGAEARTQGKNSLFAAFDLQSLQSNGWNPSFNARAGARRAGKDTAVSAFCEFSSGRLPYLGFSTLSQTIWSLGLGFEL
ncbi:MAG: DUF1207 domain-containing protein [Elusimicrobiales bacterium]